LANFRVFNFYETPAKGSFNLSLPSLRLAAQDQVLSGWLNPALPCSVKTDIKIIREEAEAREKDIFL